jgi:Ca2+-binding EF-hand superfamily protein
MLSKSASGIPNSRGEAVLAKMQDAYDEAIASGRPFLGLCSLIDNKMTGKISKPELIHTFKMMSCVLTADELDAVAEVLPEEVISREGVVSYNSLNSVLQGHTPRQDMRRGAFGVMDATPYRSTLPRRQRTAGALPSYATPHTTTRGSAALLGARGGISTPMGVSISIPTKAVAPGSSATYRNMLDSIWLRIANAIEENTASWKGRFDLSKQFSVYDIEGSGFVSMDTFQATLEDIGVSLSPTELSAITVTFGHPEADAVDYEEFCGGMDKWLSQVESSAAPAGAANWITPRIVDRLRLLRREGQNPRDLFDVLDVERCGLVSLLNQLILLLFYVITRFARLSREFFEKFCLE